MPETERIGDGSQAAASSTVILGSATYTWCTGEWDSSWVPWYSGGYHSTHRDIFVYGWMPNFRYYTGEKMKDVLWHYDADVL